MLLYYSGNLTNGKIIPHFTEVKPTDSNLQITNVIPVQKNVVGIDKSKKIYEWKILPDDKAHEKNQIDGSPYIIGHFVPSKPLNELFYSKDGSIIDMKNTKNELFVVDEKCSISSLKIKADDKLPFINFKLVANNLIPNNKIVKICCGASHCIALSNKGIVYSWGTGSQGRLGQGKTNDIASPQLMCHLLTYNVVDISCGLAHNIALGYEKQNSLGIQDNRLQLITWGAGNKGCLGLSSTEDIYIPCVNDFFNSTNIKEVHCGYNHTVVLTNDGDVYTYGSNEYGQLGQEGAEDFVFPQKVTFPQKFLLNDSGTIQNVNISRVWVGPCHNFAISDDGDMYSWGLGSYGQLGMNKLVLKQIVPVMINNDDVQESEVSNNITSNLFPRDRIKKYLQNIVIVPCFDCTFLLINLDKKFKSDDLDSSFSSVNESMYKKPSLQERSTIEYNDNQLLKQMSSDNVIMNPMFKESVLSQSSISQKDNHQDDILNNIIHFVSTHLPSLKIDKYYQSEKYKTYSKEDEELHLKVVEDTQKDFVNKIKEIETQEKNQKKIQEKREKLRNKLKDVWVKDMLPYWHYKKTTHEMRELWKRGIPPSLRDQIWTLAIGNRLSITRKYYEINLKKAKALRELLKNKSEDQIKKIFIEQYGSDMTKENTLRLIDLDLPRTFPSLAIFNNKDSPIYENLQNVLDAFVISRPDIGYIQGMSFIAGLMLLYMQPYDAFRCFSNIICKMSMVPLYLVDEQQINNRMAMFKIILETNNPELCDHFEKERVQPQSYLFKWLLTVYTNVINLDAASRVWDLFFMDGDIILYKAAIGRLTILKIRHEELIVQDLEGILKILSHLGEYIFDEDELTDEIYKVQVPGWVLEEFDKFTYEFTP